jgi:hypothetical protein
MLEIYNDITAQIQKGEKGENGPVVVTLIPFKPMSLTGPVAGLLAEDNITE